MQHSRSYIRLSFCRDNNVFGGKYPTDLHEGLTRVYLDPVAGTDPQSVPWHIPVEAALLGDPVISEDETFEVRGDQNL